MPLSSVPHWQDVLVALRQIIRATDIHSKKMMRSTGLTVPQMVVLRALSEGGASTARGLAERVSLSQATMTAILQRLEAKDLIRRSRNASDRRVIDVTLTETGAAVVESAPPLLHDAFLTRFERLDSWEQTQILSSLQRVAAMMGAADLDAAPMLDVAPPSDQPE